MPLKIGVPDLVSNSYFPAVAAVELGFLREEGIDASVGLISPVSKTYAALRDGEIDLVGGSAHSALAAFPEWKGVKLLCAQSQGTYWFLVMRSDLAPQRNDLDIVKGRRIGAAPWVDLTLRRLLREGGIDVARDQVQIMPVPGTVGETVNFGVTAARALEDGMIDGFWANGMGAEVATRRGVGTVVLDVRRGDGPKLCFDYTMPAIAAADMMIERSPQTAAAVVGAIVKTQKALKQDVRRAETVGEKLFPPDAAALIADVVRRDLPFYDAAISEKSVEGMNAFARDLGILKGHPAYSDVVATQFHSLWKS